MPGCQVLVARKGIVVLNKAYGKFIYDGDQGVNTGDLYDIASLTKVCSTTPVIMKLCEQGNVDINNRLSDYLHYLKNTNKRDILIRDIMMHQARLQAWIPFYYSLLEPVFRGQSLFSKTVSATNSFGLAADQFVNRYTGFRNGVVSPRLSDDYPFEVAGDIYLTRAIIDTVYMAIVNSPLRDKQEYLYSDLGFYLFSMMMDTITGKSLDVLAEELFYNKLGAYRLCYHPLERYDVREIVPTENDQFFRKQILQGYVHDQGAALLGGVSGHAGLFSNANDLAKLFQMYLNGGEYGGERYLEAKTIEQFTRGGQGMEKNRRALGFDKPEPDTTKSGPSCLSASTVSYGHSGFTGTMVWNDPEYDIVYVFLSNRVYPDANNNRLAEMNIRTDIQQVVYNAIIDK
jgi:CubicO group peptidase (beta-lactamase class C family)